MSWPCEDGFGMKEGGKTGGGLLSGQDESYRNTSVQANDEEVDGGII